MTYPKEHNSYEADVPQPAQDGISDRAIHNGNTRPASNDWSYYSDQPPAPPQSGGALRGFLFGMVSMALLGLVGIGWFLFARRPPQEAAVSPSTSESEAVETIPDGADSEGSVPEETVPEAASSEADAQSAIGSDAQPSQASRSNLPPAPAVDLQINHPNGSTAQLTGLTFTDNSIVADLTVTNGYKNPIELNRVDSMVIVDSAGNQYNLAAPPNNEEVRIDPGTTLEGRFVFSGHLAPGVISQYNQALSEKRAEAVKNDLVQNFGVDASRLQTEGLGESNPVAPNTHADGSDHPENRQKNRRVEVLIQTPQGDV